MLSSKKPEIEKFLNPLIKPLSGLNPNVLTLLGSIPPIFFFVFVMNGNYILALVAFLGSGIDLLDGMVARRYGKTTNFGGFLDSTLDRVSDFLMITAFAFGGIARWEIIAPLLLFSFLTSYIRSRAGLASQSHTEFAIGLIERPERYIFLFTALLFHMFLPDFMINQISLAELIILILVFLSAYTVLQRIRHAQKTL
jgi:archaetidylinositol phosphate synthase